MAAAARAEAEALLAVIVASSSDAIVSLSLDGVITSWNAAAEKLFGYPAGDIVGHPIRTLVPPDREREQTVRFQRVLRGSAAQEWETERKPELKSHISQLETYYDSTYESPGQGAPPPTLSPEIEQFLKDLDLGQGN